MILLSYSYLKLSVIFSLKCSFSEKEAKNGGGNPHKKQ